MALIYAGIFIAAAVEGEPVIAALEAGLGDRSEMQGRGAMTAAFG